jgi:hypothetical protein
VYRLFHPLKWIDHLRELYGFRWIKWLLCLAVVAVSGLLPFVGLVTSDYRLRQLQMVILGIPVLVILMQWPPLGFFGILLGAYFIPYSGPGGVNIVVLGVGGIAAVWVADMVVRQKRIHFTEPRTTLAVFALIISAALSFVIGQFAWQPLAPHAPITAQGGGLVIFVFSGLAFLLIGNLIDDIRWLKVFTWVFLAIGVLYIAARLNQQVEDILTHVFVRDSFRGSLFFVWILIIPFSQALLNTKMHPGWRIALFVFSLSVIYVSVVQASSWKSGYIPPLVGLLVVIMLKLRKYSIWLIPVVVISTWLIMQNAVATDEYSVVTRLEAWEIVLQLSSVSSLFGLGFANYYWYTPLIPINGWQVNFNSHSQYVDIIAQTGLVGLICFLWIFWEMLRIAWSLRLTAPEGFEKAYVYGAIGGLAGTLVAGFFADWVLPFVYNIGMSGMRSSILSWLFLGGLIVIHKLVNDKKNSFHDALTLGGEND